MSAPPPPGKPSVKKEGFLIKEGVITCNGYERFDSARLEKLFHPERTGGTHRTHKKYIDEAKRLFSRPFFAAQLRFYGITFPRSATEAQLSSLLDKAIAAKQCIHVPPSVVALHIEMRVAYEKKLKEWRNDIEDWDTTWKLRQEEKWAQLETPAERASHDLDRFMEHYFLTDRVPDQAKQPDPLALHNIADDQVISGIIERAAQVPGLELVSAGSGPDRAICIGWDRAAVYLLAGELDNISRENQKKRIEVEWEKAMGEHLQFVGHAHPPYLAPTAPRDNNTTRKALRLARGSFAIQCQPVTDVYHHLPNITKLALDIADSPAHNGETLRASVELGVFQGTAVLSFSEEILEWFTKRYDKTALEVAPEALQAVAANSTVGTKRKASVHPNENAHPRKQRKVGEHQAGRIYLRMRGLMATDGRICPDIQHGYLDFTDSSWNQFHGVFDIPGVGVDIEVEGFRVAATAAVEPPPWDTYWPAVCVQLSASAPV